MNLTVPEPSRPDPCDWVDSLCWFAIQSKPKAEVVAMQTLESLGLEVFLPRWRARTSRGRDEYGLRPLFPGYFFGRLRLRHHLRAVQYSRGVIRVVGAGHRPVPVEDEIIAACRARLDETGCVELDEPGPRRGDRVSIESGPFAGFQGVFEREFDDHQRVVILLEALRQAQLILDRRHLALVKN